MGCSLWAIRLVWVDELGGGGEGACSGMYGTPFNCEVDSKDRYPTIDSLCDCVCYYVTHPPLGGCVFSRVGGFLLLCLLEIEKRLHNCCTEFANLQNRELFSF